MNEPPRTLLQQFSQDIVDITAACRPAVATIRGPGPTVGASGSGFLVDGAGSVVTNFHVVEGQGAEVRVQFAGGQAQRGAVLGVDPLTDLAVVRVSGPLPKPLRIRTTPPALGEVCLAIGSPLGDYTDSVGLGIVSGLARTIPTTRGRPLERAIQTDVVINPGNSGGPLIDTAGAVLGVNTCVDTRAIGIGFAIPGATLAWVITQIARYGDVRRGALGVAVATRVQIIDERSRHAPVITRVAADIAADLRAGDVILAVAGQPVADRADIGFILTRDLIGAAAPVELWRDGVRVCRDVVIREYVPPAAVNPG